MYDSHVRRRGNEGWEGSANQEARAIEETPTTTMRFGSRQHEGRATDDEIPAASGAGGAARYRLGARLSPTAEIYEVFHPELPGRLAMKLHRRASGVGAVAVDAFRRDAARAAALRHPNIGQVVETGRLRDGTPFTTMEYLTGHTLEELIVAGVPGATGAPAAPGSLLPLLRDVAAALTAAHGAGLVHGEVRPDNIFVAEIAGHPLGFGKLLDFGVCHLTAALAAAGRPPATSAARFLAPEQLEGRLADADGRADQFALAAIALGLLGGGPPDSSPLRPAEPGGARPRATTLARRAPAVDAVLMKALSSFPEHRFESIALFSKALAEAVAGAGLISPSVMSGLGADAVPTNSRPSDDGDPWATSTREAASLPLARALAERRSSARRRGNTGARSSLTEQFFQEGDRQEASEFKDQPPERELEEDAAALDFDSFDRVPKQRKPLVAALVSLAVAAAALGWWAGLRPPERWRRLAASQGSPQEEERLHEPRRDQPLSEAAVPGANQRQPGPRSDLGDDPGRTAPSAAAGAAEPEPATVTEMATATATGDVAPGPRPPAGVDPSAARPGPSIIPGSAGTTGLGSGALPVRRARTRPIDPVTGPPPPALRGFIWSPEANALVPAGETAAQPGGPPGQWPPPFESPPPPPFNSSPTSSADSPDPLRVP